MPLQNRGFRRLFISLLALATHPALSQNLLVNPGFDRDLSGWTIATKVYPDPSPSPGYVEASTIWASNDASGSSASGGALLHARAGTGSYSTIALTQCVPITEGILVSFGARFLTTRQYFLGAADVTVELFAGPACSGQSAGTASATSLPSVIQPSERNSGGQWLPAASQVLAPLGIRSARLSVGAHATGSFAYGLSYVDAVADEAFLTAAPATLTTSLLPAAAWVHGAGGSYWTTTFTLVNPGSTDAAVTLKWLGHDVDGRNGRDFHYVVRAGETLALESESTWEAYFRESWGAILVTSSSPSVFLQSETSTNVPGGGTVGQALGAFGASDFAGASPKTIAPIRENSAFRTNLVLANAVEFPITVHVALIAADGTLLGSRDVTLPPLGATQINRVASALGSPTLDTGRIAVSTPTPGGLVAAYASVIDNATNDPRTLLPQDASPAVSGPNLLANPGFDHDLSGWTLTLNGPAQYRSGAWDSKDANGDVRSGSAHLSGSTAYDVGGNALLHQCVPVAPGRSYGLQAKISWTSGGKFLARPMPALSFRFHASSDCTGETLGGRDDVLYQVVNPAPYEWLAVPTFSAVAPDTARSASVELSIGLSPFGGVDAYFDDAVFSEGPSTWTSVVPAAASISGLGGSLWTTTLTLANPTSAVATSYLYGPAQNLPAGSLLSIPDVVRTVFGRSQTWFPLFPLATSPAIAVTAETSTPAPGGGTMGQAISAFRGSDLVGATPKSIAPIRDDGAFRTNLVLANATETPLTVHVDLFDSNGTSIGSRDVPLPALGATQIGGIGWSLAGTSVNPGRISVSTPTPGGRVAAYASVIDNRTNDPRTLLPR